MTFDCTNTCTSWKPFHATVCVHSFEPNKKKNRGTKLSNMSILRLKAYWSSCATWGSKTCREVAHGPVCLLKAVSIRRDKKKNQDNNDELK